VSLTIYELAFPTLCDGVEPLKWDQSSDRLYVEVRVLEGEAEK